MKSLLVILSFVSTAAFAAKMEPGHYQGWDVDTQTVMADLVLNADQTLFFNLQTPDFVTPEPGCTGSYVEVGNDVTSDVTCPMDFLPTAAVRMDVTAVTPELLRSADGVAVPVYVDALGSDPIIFKLKLIEAPVLP
jgi:hypothetical protein